MATRIIEYGGKGRPDGFPVIMADRKLVEQTAMTATSTSAQSSAFTGGTDMVCIDTDEDIFVNFAASPTATANSIKVYAKVKEFFSVTPGWKAAIKT